MRIGVKYCGGCNQGYDRKAAVEKLGSRLSGSIIGPVNEKEEYDKILLVCGCTRTCIRNYRAARAGSYILLKNEKEFDDLVECLHQEEVY